MRPGTQEPVVILNAQGVSVFASTSVAPLPAHQLLVLLLQVSALLLVAVGLRPVLARIGLPSVVGELSAGILLGPTVLGHLSAGFSGWLFPASASQFHLLDALGQLGVVMLIGVTGMEVDLALVRRRGTTALRIGFCGLVLPLGLGVGTGMLIPASLLAAGSTRLGFALFLGVALCVSALPVISKMLGDMHLLHRDVGQLTLAAATFDDVVGWLLLSVVSAVAVGSVHTGAVVLSVGRTVVLVTIATVLARPVIRTAMSRRWRDADIRSRSAMATLLILLGAALTLAAGLEAMFGAFLVGTVIGTAGPEVAASLAPLREFVMAVLAPIFFAIVGLRIDLLALTRPLVLVTLAVVLVVAVTGKFAGVFLGARVGRVGRWEALAVGAGLNARGAIQIAIATAGLRLGALSESTYTIIVLVAVATTVMTPPILALVMRHVQQTAAEELRLAGGTMERTGRPSWSRR